MKRIFSLTLIGILAISGMGALAQQADLIDVEAIEERARVFAGDAQEIVNAGQPDDKARTEAEELVDAALAQVEGVDPGAGGSNGGPIDFGQMIVGARGLSARPEGSPLLISFVSLSMPPESLARVVEETSAAGGLVVFRGFSAQGTGAFVRALVAVTGEDGAHNVTIDPRLFRAFSVDRVPAYVAVSRSFDPCDTLDCITTPPPHDKLVGNVPLEFALTRFSESNGPGAPVARMGLVNLRGR